ncbi:HEAT repeat domain-containing protein [Verrucomicrobia bacterium]|nr:HEAT repeat domain-containing protein [Verrucomicrobiota bacterium]
MIRRFLFVLLLAPFCLQAQETFPPVEELVQDLKSGNQQEKRDAARLLSMMGEKASPATKALVASLDTGKSQIWFHSVTALANIGNAVEDEAIPALVDAFRDRSRYQEQVRFRSAHALSRIGKRVIPALRKAMDSSSSTTRQGVCMTLGGMGDAAESGYDLLEKALSDESSVVRGAAIDALGGLGKPVVPLLRKSLKSDEALIQDTAVLAIAKLGKDGASLKVDLFRVLKNEKDEDDQSEIIRAIAAVGGSSSEMIQQIEYALMSGNVDLMNAAYDVVLRLKRDSAPLVVLGNKWLQSGDVMKQEQAAEIASVMGSHAASLVGGLVKIASKIEDHSEKPWATVGEGGEWNYVVCGL